MPVDELMPLALVCFFEAKCTGSPNDWALNLPVSSPTTISDWMRILHRVFRIACMAAQMSSPKVVDGVAKMIYKADLDAAKKRKQQLQEAEEGLRDAWHVTQLAGHFPSM